MERRMLECLDNKPSRDHILPFFWQHGEEHELLAQEIAAIQNCGINEFCVESRIHEQFGEEKWWEDFGFILKEARSRGMRVWLLDDKHFPTGYANNYIADHPELRMTLLRVKYFDYAGPQTEMALLPEPLDEDETYVTVTAYRRTEKGKRLSGEGIELVSKLENGLLWWDIPEGIWRVYYVIRTHRACSSDKENYIDMLSPESCKAMLHAVYEPHYEHFGEYFGNTFAGFFSDEPSFANDVGSYNSILGREGMLLPWSDDLPGIIADQSGQTEETVRRLLPSLWHEIENRTSIVREGYMEAVTEKYSRNFCYMLGDWCRSHHVMYIGHIIEDMNTHQRLGHGAGHFFRALDGQDMAGIDVVLNQMIPGHLALDHTAYVMGDTVDPEFFHYMLAKLASSHAHIQPLKQGRAMCEIFGAFGWAEGIPMMKYLTDHMLVSGINYFVPHAFSPKYPDSDCPPHFYAHGTNSQYPLFQELMQYTARMAHVMTGGIHRADVAVYYNAEAEWSRGKYMLQQKVCRVLTRCQIDFDLIPQDVLVVSQCREERLLVQEERYGALIVPYSQYLPKRVMDAMERLLNQGLKIVFIDQLPEMTSEHRAIGRGMYQAEVMGLEELDDYLTGRGCRSVKPEASSEALRFYHIERKGCHLFLFWNEDLWEKIDTYVDLPARGRAFLYDGWKNRIYLPEQKESAVRLKLAPNASVLVCVEPTGQEQLENVPDYDYGEDKWEEVSWEWDISVRAATEEEFIFFRRGGLGNLARELPEFAGMLRYEAVLSLPEAEKLWKIDLGRVGETAQLWVNHVYCGSCVSAPFRFEVGGQLKEGENRIRVEVMSNPGYSKRDSFSRYLPLPPTGLLGPVKWAKEN